MEHSKTSDQLIITCDSEDRLDNCLLWHLFTNFASIPVFVLYFAFIFAADSHRFDASIETINTLKIRFLLDVVFLDSLTGFLCNAPQSIVLSRQDKQQSFMRWSTLLLMLFIYVSAFLLTSPFTGPISISIFVILTLFMRLF